MKILTSRTTTLFSIAIIVIAILTTIGITSKAYAITFPVCTWTGDGGNNNFSNAANWSGCGGIPISGSGLITSGTYEWLVFDNTSLTQNEVLNNDLGPLVINTVRFTGTNPTFSYRIGGDPIVGGPGATSIIDSTISTNPSGFNDTLNFAAHASEDINITNPNGTYFAKLEGGEATLVAGPGGVLQVADLSQMDGVMAFIQPELELMPTGNMTAESVNINGLSTLIIDNQGNSNSTYTYDLNLDFSNYLNGNSQILLPGANNTNDESMLTGNVVLDNDVSVNANGGNTLNITGPITDNGNNISSVAKGDTSVSVPIADDQSASSPTIGQNVIYYVDGLLGDITVGEGGLLKGNGTVSSADIESGGGIAPGHSPGCLTVSGNFTLAGNYIADIQNPGNTACTDYDQIIVGGAINLTGASLDPEFLNGYIPSIGQSFEIIQNNGTDPINGIFSGLPEGAVFNVQNVNLKITYSGDGGNNIVLTVVPSTISDTASIHALQIKAPNTGFGKPANITVLINKVSIFLFILILIGTTELIIQSHSKESDSRD